MVTQGTLQFVEIGGTPRERGRAHGETLRSRIALGLKQWKASLQMSTGRDPDDWLDRFVEATNFLPAIERWTPHLLEEVRGIAEGAAVPFRDAYAYQLIDEEWSFRFDHAPREHSPEHCSVIAASRAGAHPILAQNMDLPTCYDGTQTLLRLDFSDGRPDALIFTPAGIIVTCGLNSAGIGVCVNTLGQLPHANEGLPVAFVVRRLLECGTVAEAVAFLRSVRHASGQNYAIGGPEGVVDFECSAAGTIEHRPNGDRLVHTNHPLAAAGSEQEGSMDYVFSGAGKNADPTNSERRYDFLQRELTGRDLTVERAEELLSSRETPISFARRVGAGLVTLGSLVMELSVPPVLHLAPGPPGETSYATWTLQ